MSSLTLTFLNPHTRGAHSIIYRKGSSIFFPPFPEPPFFSSLCMLLCYFLLRRSGKSVHFLARIYVYIFVGIWVREERTSIPGYVKYEQLKLSIIESFIRIHQEPIRIFSLHKLGINDVNDYNVPEDEVDGLHHHLLNLLSASVRHSEIDLWKIIILIPENIVSFFLAARSPSYTFLLLHPTMAWITLLHKSSITILSNRVPFFFICG